MIEELTPVLKTVDEVYLYEGSDYYCANKDEEGKWFLISPNRKLIRQDAKSTWLRFFQDKLFAVRWIEMKNKLPESAIGLKFKRLHKDAVLPQHSKPGDAGLDLTAVKVVFEKNKRFHHYGLAVEIPEGNVGLIFPRSSIHKQKERLSNSVGVIDSGYRGELMAVFDEVSLNNFTYEEGNRTAQLVIVPYISCNTEWAEELSETERGQGGYGSTGR